MFAKVCGLTRLTDALHAVKHGATAVGFVFWPKSPRFIAPELAAGIIRELPGTVIAVGVFVNQPIDEITRIAAQTGIAAIQLHGDEPPAYAPALPWPVLRATALEEVNGSLADCSTLFRTGRTKKDPIGSFFVARSTKHVASVSGSLFRRVGGPPSEER